MTDKDQKSHKINKQKEKDNDLWAEMTKDVEPLKDKNTASLSPPKPAAPAKPKGESQTDPGAKTIPKSNPPPSQSGGSEVDHRTKQRLKRGQISIDGRLDLHGMGQNQAYDALLHFIPKAHSEGKRCVLIVTGKGHNRHGDTSLLNRKTGVLKQKTPQWLSEPPLDQYILNIQPARPQHGGEGALYVLLRRKR